MGGEVERNSTGTIKKCEGKQTCIDLGLFRRHSSEVTKVAFVANQHDDDVGVGMVTELLQPSLHILVGQVFRNIVDQQRPHCSAVITAQSKISTAAKFQDYRYH